MDTRSAIGMFDSGIGGLTVLKAVQEKLPHEEIIYFADTARLPYGDKSPETILRYSIENSIFLMDKGIKLLVVACNTASSAAAHKLAGILKVPVIGVIKPGAKKASQVTKKKKVAILGTKATVESQAYPKAIHAIDPTIEVHSIACPLFVPFIEEGMHHHSAAKLIVEEYLAPLKNLDIDTLLLGCTHYPALKETLQQYVGDKVQIIDSASTCADEVLETLVLQKLKSPAQEKVSHQYFVTDNPDKFKRLGERFVPHISEALLVKNHFT